MRIFCNIFFLDLQLKQLCLSDLQLLFFNTFQKEIIRLVDKVTAMVLHQSYMSQCHSLLTLISYYTIVFSFAPMFTDGWFTDRPRLSGLLCFVKKYRFSEVSR